MSLRLLESQFIYEEAPYPSCHASTIVETDGGIAAAWFGGTAEKHPDVGIWMSHRTAGAGWSTPVEVCDGAVSPTLRYPTWNPVLFQPTTGPLLLFYKVGPTPVDWWSMLARSEDGGAIWSRPERLPAGILGPIKNKPLELENGDILCPSSDEKGGWRVHFERSTDWGRIWVRTSALEGGSIGAIQPSLLLHPDGRLQAIGRTQQGRLFSSDSTDDGFTWSRLFLLDVPNPNSGTDAVTLADGRFLLVYNHSADQRTPLNVALSSNGTHWMPVLTLEDEPGEYSYPAVIQAADGLIHITYTWNRRRIRHVVLAP